MSKPVTYQTLLSLFIAVQAHRVLTGTLLDCTDARSLAVALFRDCKVPLKRRTGLFWKAWRAFSHVRPQIVAGESCHA